MLHVKHFPLSILRAESILESKRRLDLNVFGKVRFILRQCIMFFYYYYFHEKSDFVTERRYNQ